MREAPVAPPGHPFEHVEQVEFYCWACDDDFTVEPDSLETGGVDVICPGCTDRFFVALA